MSSDWDWDWDWESRIENRNSPSADSIMPGATTTTTPQLLTMKECSDKKVPLVRMFQDDPLYPLSTKNQVDSDNNNLGESNMIKEKVIKNP